FTGCNPRAAVGGVAAAAGALRGASLAGRAGGTCTCPAPAAPPMTPTMAPTGAVSPSCTRISLSTPASVAGTSIDTLSVSISNRLSPGCTASPADLNHLVTLPSATVSPSCGMRMFMSFLTVVRHPDERATRALIGEDPGVKATHPSRPAVGAAGDAANSPVHRHVLRFQK